jgi:hypothetical protein
MKIESRLIILVFFILCTNYKKMFLGCLSCIFNYKKRTDEEKEIEAIYYERAKFLPFYL